MAYARFSETSDLYLFHDGHEGMTCMGCKLAELVPTVFTRGTDEDHYFGPIDPCPKCGGEGCKACMIHGTTILRTPALTLAHLEEHAEAGHAVPDTAFERVREDIERDVDYLEEFRPDPRWLKKALFDLLADEDEEISEDEVIIVTHDTDIHKAVDAMRASPDKWGLTGRWSAIAPGDVQDSEGDEGWS